MVTSFSSKSELALNLSTDGQVRDLHGLPRPGRRDRRLELEHAGRDRPDEPGPEHVLPRRRAASTSTGKFHFTETNAYSGNNGRAAILNDAPARTCSTPPATPATAATRSRTASSSGPARRSSTAQVKALVAQNPGAPTPVGSFNITQLGDRPDKIGKDTNFRGLTIFDNVLYYTKGSGGNGVNTVYFVDTTGSACPNGVGLPGRERAAADLAARLRPLAAPDEGVQPNNMCILEGFPTALKSKTSFPFGIWFANANTLYVADEGNGDNTFSATASTRAAAQTTAGLQKWVLRRGRRGSWPTRCRRV